MNYQAIFVGGAFDMTKRCLNAKRDRIYFYEPLDPYAILVNRAPVESVPCRELTYKLTYETQMGTLVYELERIG